MKIKKGLFNPLTCKILLTSYFGILGVGLIYSYIVPLIINMSGIERFIYFKKINFMIAILGLITTYYVYLYFKKTENLIFKIENNIDYSTKEIINSIKSLDGISFFFLLPSCS